MTSPEPTLQNEVFIEEETISGQPRQRFTIICLSLEFILYSLAWLLGLVVIGYLGRTESWPNCSASFQSWLIIGSIVKLCHLLVMMHTFLRKINYFSCCRFRSRTFTILKICIWVASSLADVILAIWGTVLLTNSGSCLNQGPVDHLLIILMVGIVVIYWMFSLLLLLLVSCAICLCAYAWETRSDNIKKSTPQMIQNNSFSSVIANLTDLNNDSCDICCEDFLVGEKIRRLKCHHYFHQVCIDTWLDQSQLCPHCRQNITEAHNLFTTVSTPIVSALVP